MKESLKKLSNSAHKHVKHGVAATALLATLIGAPSCGNKNAGMPQHVNNLELSSADESNTTSEYIEIKDNKVVFGGVFDIGENPSWMKKNLRYSIEVNKGDDEIIKATIEGTTVYGGEGKSFKKKLSYSSLEDFNTNFAEQANSYIEEVADELQNSDDVYADSEEVSHETLQRRADNLSRIGNKTELLLGWLKYNTNKKLDRNNPAQKYPVQKESKIVSLPIERNGNVFDFQIQEKDTIIGLQKKASINKKNSVNTKVYDITLNENTEFITLPTDPLLFAEELTSYIEANLKVGKISDEKKTQLFFGKCFEAQQLLDNK